MKTIGIIGARVRNTKEDYEKVKEEFLKIYEVGDIICSGGCPKGGDRFAEMIAKELNIKILIFKPEWEKYGKSAGYKRNGEIAKNSDVLIACVSEERIGGTEDTIKKFKEFNPFGEIILV